VSKVEAADIGVEQRCAAEINLKANARVSDSEGASVKFLVQSVPRR
jgi:hypothetical protein